MRRKGCKCTASVGLYKHSRQALNGRERTLCSVSILDTKLYTLRLRILRTCWQDDWGCYMEGACASDDASFELAPIQDCSLHLNGSGVRYHVVSLIVTLHNARQMMLYRMSLRQYIGFRFSIRRTILPRDIRHHCRTSVQYPSSSTTLIHLDFISPGLAPLVSTTMYSYPNIFFTML